MVVPEAPPPVDAVSLPTDPDCSECERRHRIAAAAVGGLVNHLQGDHGDRVTRWVFRHPREAAEFRRVAAAFELVTADPNRPGPGYAADV